MKQCVSRDWHGVWSLSVSVKCSLNTIKLKQAPRYCCELAERWTVCYAFSNATDPKAKLFSSKPLLPMFFTSHLVARCRSLEAAQETSSLVPPPDTLRHTYAVTTSRRAHPANTSRIRPVLSATTSAVPLGPRCCSPRPLLPARLPASSLASLRTFSRAIIFPCKLGVFSAENLRTSHELLGLGLNAVAQPI